MTENCKFAANYRILTNLPPKLKPAEIKQFFVTYLDTLDKKYGNFEL